MTVAMRLRRAMVLCMVNSLGLKTARNDMLRAWIAFFKTIAEPKLKAPFICHSSAPRYNRAMPALTRLVALLLTACALSLPALPVAAHDHDEHERARQALEQGRVLPLASVIAKVEREHPGQVVKIEFEEDDGRYIYEIRLLQRDGRMAKLKVDAVDGRVLKIKRKERKE